MTNIEKLARVIAQTSDPQFYMEVVKIAANIMTKNKKPTMSVQELVGHQTIRLDQNKNIQSLIRGQTDVTWVAHTALLWGIILGKREERAKRKGKSIC